MRTDFGVSPWSEWARFEVGLLQPDDWTARFVEVPEAEVPPAGEERSVRTDALTLLFRKRYYAELRAAPRLLTISRG